MTIHKKNFNFSICGPNLLERIFLKFCAETSVSSLKYAQENRLMETRPLPPALPPSPLCSLMTYTGLCITMTGVCMLTNH